MNKTLKYIILLAIACFVSKGYAQELKSEVFSLLNLDYPGLEKVKALHQEGKVSTGVRYIKVINLLTIMEKISTGNTGR